MTKIDFEITQDGQTFRDALYLQDDHGLTEDEIHLMQMERFNNWIAFVAAASQEVAE
jgi:hypothetical protein